MTTAFGCSLTKAGVRAMAGSLVLVTSLGAGTAMAGSARHHGQFVRGQAVRSDFNALVGPGPEAPAPAMGGWRNRVFRGGGCDRSYPMHEGFPCGSATGGPVGGMGS